MLRGLQLANVRNIFILALTLLGSSGLPHRFSLFPVTKPLCSVVKLQYEGGPPGPDTGGPGYWSLETGRTHTPPLGVTWVFLPSWHGLQRCIEPSPLWLKRSMVSLWSIKLQSREWSHCVHGIAHNQDGATGLPAAILFSVFGKWCPEDFWSVEVDQDGVWCCLEPPEVPGTAGDAIMEHLWRGQVLSLSSLEEGEEG